MRREIHPAVKRWDFHAWIVLSKKEWDGDEAKGMRHYYDTIAKHRLGHSDYSFVRLKCKEETLPEDFKSFVTEYEEGLRSFTKDELWDESKGKLNKCLHRVVAVQLKYPRAKIVYGSLELQSTRSDGSIWWEYGNGSETY
jgi:hypothetical protein